MEPCWYVGFHERVQTSVSGAQHRAFFPNLTATTAHTSFHHSPTLFCIHCHHYTHTPSLSLSLSLPHCSAHTVTTAQHRSCISPYTATATLTSLSNDSATLLDTHWHHWSTPLPLSFTHCHHCSPILFTPFSDRRRMAAVQATHIK